jgi:hypothetical protein
MTDAPTTLVFCGRRPLVTDGDGALLASLAKGLSGGRFAATAADGSTLCSGRSRWGGMSSRWDVVAGDGASLLTYAGGWLRPVATVTLADGRVLSLRGRVFAADVELLGASGETVARGASRRAGLFARSDFVVTQLTPQLDLAELVAVTTVWLTARNNASAGAAAGAVAAAGAAGAAG